MKTLKTLFFLFFLMILLPACSTNQNASMQLKSDFKPEQPAKRYPGKDIYSRTKLILAPDQLYNHYQINGIRNALGEIEVTEAFYEPYSPLETTLALKKIVNTHNKSTCGENAPQNHWTEKDIKDVISANSRTSVHEEGKTLIVHIVREDCTVYSFKWRTGDPQENLRKNHKGDPEVAFLTGSAPF